MSPGCHQTNPQQQYKTHVDISDDRLLRINCTQMTLPQYTPYALHKLLHLHVTQVHDMHISRQ